jgi:hypothetical protein
MNYIERVADAWSCKGSFLKKKKKKEKLKYICSNGICVVSKKMFGVLVF